MNPSRELPITPRILVVEDEREFQFFISSLVQKAGFEVVVAGSGKAAVEFFLNQHFDLVLMDCQMPGMNGYETTRALRDVELKRKKQIPIIAYAGDAGVGQKERCLQAGMTDLLLKPAKADELVGMITRWLPQEFKDHLFDAA